MTIKTTHTHELVASRIPSGMTNEIQIICKIGNILRDLGKSNTEINFLLNVDEDFITDVLEVLKSKTRRMQLHGHASATTNIIWKRLHSTHSLLIDETPLKFVGTVNTFKADGSLATTKSWGWNKSQSGWDSLHIWFKSELAKLGIERPLIDIPTNSRAMFGRPEVWPNGDLRNQHSPW